MPKYLIIADYTADGVKGVLAKGGSARKTAVEQEPRRRGARWRASISVSATATPM